MTAHAEIIELKTGDTGEAIKAPFHEVFGLGAVKAAMRATGDPIMIDVLNPPTEEYAPFVEPKDPNYIFDIDLLRKIVVAMQLNMPLLMWGYHGTGKTTLAEQYCAHTNRPSIRVQHTVSTEESHVLGQLLVRGGATVFEPGPLTVAMKEGLVYIADEYDFALPSVIAVYQSVLEGKSLIIKEAPLDWRVIRPHPNFRFIATGNTNGAGDDSGLYQGTQIQNAASYSRFKMTIEVGYMAKNREAAVVCAQTRLHIDHATLLVEFAHDVRDLFKRSEISTTVSPRELISAGQLARVMAKPQEVNNPATGEKETKLRPDLRAGIELAFTNRLNPVDREAVSQKAQRLFG